MLLTHACTYVPSSAPTPWIDPWWPLLCNTCSCSVVQRASKTLPCDLIEDGDSRADILSVLRSDACRAAVEAAAAAQVARDSAPARTVATVGTMTDAVATRDVGSLATFSLATGARMVSSEVQCSVRMVQRAMQATRDVSDASVGATVSTEDASTSHYLVLGIGLAHLPEPNQLQAEQPPEPWVPPPPVFADCSHYGTLPRSLTYR